MTLAPRNGEAVKYIQSLVNMLKEADLEIESLKNKLKHVQGQKKDLEENIIPDAMTEIGVQQIQLLTNEIVTVKPFYFARLPSEPEPFFHWLRDNGFGGLIKEKLEVIPDSEYMELIKEFLDELKTQYEQMSTIHWKTLEAWFRESIEAGIGLPTDLFINYVGRKAKIK